MKHLAFSAAMLVLPASSAHAFPEDFGLPRFVQLDNWPDASVFAQPPIGSIRRAGCANPQHADRACRDLVGKAFGKRTPRY